MNITKVLMILSCLFCLFVNTQAQGIYCSSRADLPRDPANPFPNEIVGLKFHGKGKLSALTLGVSSREDIERVFGTPLTTKPDFGLPNMTAGMEMYDYDSDWSIVFYYFDKNSGYGTGRFENGVSVNKYFVPRPEYLGKLRYFKLFPKKNISIGQMSALDGFYKEPASYPSAMKINNYYDRYGLKYQVFDRFEARVENAKILFSQGDIVEIQYFYPCFFDENIYVEQ